MHAVHGLGSLRIHLVGVAVEGQAAGSFTDILTLVRPDTGSSYPAATIVSPVRCSRLDHFPRAKAASAVHRSRFRGADT